eukprot:1160486-Pelagomonas_calceolata.AAC.5
MSVHPPLPIEQHRLRAYSILPNSETYASLGAVLNQQVCFPALALLSRCLPRPVLFACTASLFAVADAVAIVRWASAGALRQRRVLSAGLGLQSWQVETYISSGSSFSSHAFLLMAMSRKPVLSAIKRLSVRDGVE